MNFVYISFAIISWCENLLVTSLRFIHEYFIKCMKDFPLIHKEMQAHNERDVKNYG